MIQTQYCAELFFNNNTLKYCQNNQNKEKENIVPHDKTEISDFIEVGEQDTDTERANEKKETVDNNVNACHSF